MTRIPATKWHPTPRAWKGVRGAPKECIIHTIEGSAMGALSWFASSGNPYGTGAHLVFSQTNTYQTGELETLMYHCKGANTSGVGFEHQGYASNSKLTWLKKANRHMLRASANRVAWVCYHYKLGAPKKGKNVRGHGDVPGNDHTDPGKGWPWTFYMFLARRAYKNLQASDGKRWTSRDQD